MFRFARRPSRPKLFLGLSLAAAFVAATISSNSPAEAHEWVPGQVEISEPLEVVGAISARVTIRPFVDADGGL